MEKVFEGVSSVRFADVELACSEIKLHYPPDTIVNGIGSRTLVKNIEPGKMVMVLISESAGLLELSKRILAKKGRALVGKLTIVAKDGEWTFEDAITLNGPDATGRCEFDIPRDD